MFYSRFQHTTIRLAAAALLGALTMTGCDFEDPTADLELIADAQIAPAQVIGSVVDASTGEVLEGVTTSISLSGRDAGQALTVTGERTSGFDVPDVGLVNFAVDTAPTAQNPTEMRVQVSAPGYLSTSVPVSLTDSIGSFEARLVPLAGGVEGVEATLDQTMEAGNDGRTMQAAQVVTPSVDGGTTAVSVPTGTQIMDAEGNPLRGALNTTVARFSPLSEESLRSFPGGLQGLEVANEDGEVENVSFASAGFTAIEITDERGRKARTFDQAVQVDVDVPSAVVNPRTGQEVKAGDTVPVFSLETETGEWRYEKDATIVDQGDGTLGVSFETDHLSYYNLDWRFGGGYGRGGAGCSPAPEITLTNFDDAYRGAYRFTLYRRYDSGYLSYWRNSSLWSSSIRFLRASGGVPTTLKIFGPTGEELASQEIEDLCNYGGTINLPDLPPSLTVNIAAKFRCPQQRAQIRPYGAFYLRNTASWRGHWIYVRAGRVTVKGLTEGAEYEVRAWLNGRFERRTFVLDPDAAQNIDVDGVTVTQTDANTYNVVADVIDTQGAVCS